MTSLSSGDPRRTAPHAATRPARAAAIARTAPQGAARLGAALIGPALALSALLLAAPGFAQDGAEARLEEPASAAATLRGPDGALMGEVTLLQTPNGVLLTAALTNLPEGVHGFHIHETGACSPDFGAAGGHFAGANAAHGILTGEGPHAGDMPNIHVPEDGELTIEVLNTLVSLDDPELPSHLLDADGAAIMIHEGADDYASAPSGAAGGRIACGVIEPTEIEGGAPAE